MSRCIRTEKETSKTDCWYVIRLFLPIPDNIDSVCHVTKFMPQISIHDVYILADEKMQFNIHMYIEKYTQEWRRKRQKRIVGVFVYSCLFQTTSYKSVYAISPNL